MLTVEERAFQRVTKQLLSDKSVLRPALSYLPSPPPEGENEPPLYDPTRVERFREDVLLDFANLESSIIRIQLILSSNQRERERYAAEKAKILETAQAVRDNTLELRSHLQEAQQVLERRKGYDEMATKILDDRKLKSRDDAKADIEKLEKEIEDLQQESVDYEGTWISRREQFDMVIREGEAMIRQIKGIKDEPEPEKDENMDDVEDGPKDETSGRNTPIQDGRSPRPTDAGDATPLPESGEDGTPARPTNKFLEVEDATRPGSRMSSPLAQPASMPDDVDMAETPLAGSVGAELGDGKIDESMEVSAEQRAAATPSADNVETMDET
ncbi:THO complex subunit mft1 [Pseudocercospora fuligena]|uniref:THO complex subunit mft1 n=1 Tax=Pseudocercospora fuligena TaxID=685502 RepID=A0A8H6VL12_9PEZI|nr:THO complex subunit mft1 [Pseudocercospora fuligena]